MCQDVLFTFLWLIVTLPHAYVYVSWLLKVGSLSRTALPHARHHPAPLLTVGVTSNCPPSINSPLWMQPRLLITPRMPRSTTVSWIARPQDLPSSHTLHRPRPSAKKSGRSNPAETPHRLGMTAAPVKGPIGDSNWSLSHPMSRSSPYRF